MASLASLAHTLNGLMALGLLKCECAATTLQNGHHCWGGGLWAVDSQCMAVCCFCCLLFIKLILFVLAVLAGTHWSMLLAVCVSLHLPRKACGLAYKLASSTLCPLVFGGGQGVFKGRSAH